MDAPNHILGIDIGSVALAAAEIDAHKQVIHSTYVFHHGDIRGTLHTTLSSFDLTNIGAIGATSSTPKFLHTTRIYDNRVAVIAACRQFFPRIGSILLVGSERFGIIHFDEEGNYKKFRTNSSCAAGTGSFLDQQAHRLNLEGAEELARIAQENEGEIPKIASRCAVFAKTDLVHAQQEGYSLPAICEGLCRGLAKNIIDTLFEKESALSPVIFAGGVAKNSAVVHHISSILEQEIITDENAPLFGALGADLIIDEITAHARAAVYIRPDVDTIIEIGGQDSKFTTLADGMVTFSTMNTVCAGVGYPFDQRKLSHQGGHRGVDRQLHSLSGRHCKKPGTGSRI